MIYIFYLGSSKKNYNYIQMSGKSTKSQDSKESVKIAKVFFSLLSSTVDEKSSSSY